MTSRHSVWMGLHHWGKLGTDTTLDTTIVTPPMGGPGTYVVGYTIYYPVAGSWDNWSVCSGTRLDLPPPGNHWEAPSNHVAHGV